MSLKSCAALISDEIFNLCVEQVCGPAKDYPIAVDQETIKNYLHPGTQKQINDIEQEFILKKETLERYTKFVIQKQKEIQNTQNVTKTSDDDAEKRLS